MQARAPEYGSNIEGPAVLEAEPIADERGSFARLFCPDELKGFGIEFTPVQINLSRNVAKHTLRGIHDQPEPWAEGKIVRVTQGAIYDVAVDLRPCSPTFCQWCATELSAAKANGFYIPRGFAHGFITLEAGSDVEYLMDRMFEPGHGRGFRWDDPAFAIEWPATPHVIGARDAAYPNFDKKDFSL